MVDLVLIQDDEDLDAFQSLINKRPDLGYLNTVHGSPEDLEGEEYTTVRDLQHELHGNRNLKGY